MSNEKNTKFSVLIIIIGIFILLGTSCSKSDTFIEKGKQFIEIGDYDNAIKQFNKAIDAKPKNDSAYFYKAVSLAERDRKTSSRVVKCLQTVLKINPSFSITAGSYIIAKQWDKIGQKELAVAEYISFVDKYKEDKMVPEALRILAKYKASENQFDYALSFLQRINNEYPKYKHIDSVKSDIKKLDFSINAKKYEEEVKSNPQDSEARYKLGSLYYDNDLTAEGIKQIEIALSIDSSNEKARQKMAVILKDKHDYENAARAYSKLIELNPSNAEYHYSLASIQNKELRDLNSAYEGYRKCIELDSKNKDAIFELALLCERIAQFEEARKMWKEYILIDPLGERGEQAKKYLKRLEYK